VISAARFTVRPDKRKELVMTLYSLANQICQEKGCRGYRFFGDEAEGIVLIGEWESRSDWDRHLRSEHFKVLSGSVKILGSGQKLQFRVMPV